MNGKPFDDRLSAYFDDELSLEERARMEELLAASPDMQAELDEYRQISDRLNSIPVTPAPAELFGSIMRGLEREVLIPQREVATKKFRWRSLIAVAACVAVAAISVSIFRSNNHEIAQNDPPSPVTTKLPSSRLLANQNETVVGTEKNNAAHSQPFKINESDLTGAKPGDQIRAIGADGVSVIRLTVVESRDIQTAVRVLLASETAKPTGSNEYENGVVAVYVRSDSAQVTSAIERMKKELEAETMSAPVLLESSDPQIVDVLAATGADKDQKDIRQAVPVKRGSQLEKLALNQSAQSTPSGLKSDGPVQVLFLISTQPSASKPDEKNPNGAA